MEFDVMEIVAGLIVAVGGVAVGFFASQYQSLKQKASESEAKWDDQLFAVLDSLVKRLNDQNQPPQA